MLLGKLLENVLRSRNNLALAILHRLRKEHLIEEDIAQLLRRVDVEAMPGVSPHCGASLSIDTLGEVVYFDGEAIGHLTEHRGIDTDTHLLHPQKDRDERLVDGVVDVEQGGCAHGFGGDRHREEQLLGHSGAEAWSVSDDVGL